MSTRKRDMPCAVPGCPNLQGTKGARGLCTRHYQRLLSTGSPIGTATPPEARFFSRVELAGECWEWRGSLKGDGYGSFSDAKGRRGRSHTTTVHRWSWEFFRGPIPGGLVIDHLCRNRKCVNPDHLEPVTPVENSRRGLRGALRPRECKRGHAFTPNNTYITPRGARVCRQCVQISRDKWGSKQPQKELVS